MARNKNALRRAERFRKRVLELIDSLALSDREAIAQVAEDVGYDIETGERMFRGYGHYAGEACSGCHNPGRAIVAWGLCRACYQRRYRDVKSKNQDSQCLSG